MKHVLLMALLCSFFAVPAYAVNTPLPPSIISVRADDWCPYNCDAQSSKPGYGIEIMRVIYAKAAKNVDYEAMPWTEAIKAVRAGRYNALIGAKKEETPDFIFCDEPIGKSETAFIVRADDNYEYAGPASLEAKRLAAIEAYHYDDVIDPYIEGNKNNPERIMFATGANALEVNINRLIEGKVDIVVDDTNVFLYKLNEMHASDKVRILRANKSDPVYIAFSPKDPRGKEYAKMFDDGIAELRKSGELGDILSHYGLKDWK